MSEANNSGKLNDTVAIVIGCCLPHGVVLELGRAGDANYERYEMNGANSAHARRPDSKRIVAMAGTFGLTTVPKNFWDKWLKANKNAQLPFVKNGSLFAYEGIENARAHGETVRTVKTGLESLSPTADGRTPEGVEVDLQHLENGKRAAVAA